MLVVDRLLGGTGARADSVRELTIIEQNIVRKIIESALGILGDAWRSVINLGLYIESFESNPQFVQIAPASETAAVVSFEIVIRDMTYPMKLCFPYFVLDPLIQNLSTSWSNVSTKSIRREEREELFNRVRLTRLPVRAQLGSAVLTMQDYLKLKIGDVIPMKQRTDEPLKVWVDGKVKFWGTPGVSQLNRAVRITRRVTELEEIIHERNLS
jgi:flagellar motor switch protein FliM